MVFSFDVVAILLVFVHVGEGLVEKCLEFVCISADFKLAHGYTIKLCSAKKIKTNHSLSLFYKYN